MRCQKCGQRGTDPRRIGMSAKCLSCTALAKRNESAALLSRCHPRHPSQGRRPGRAMAAARGVGHNRDRAARDKHPALLQIT